MGAEPLPAPERPAVLGVSIPESGDACLNEDINLFTTTWPYMVSYS